MNYFVLISHKPLSTSIHNFIFYHLYVLPVILTCFPSLLFLFHCSVAAGETFVEAFFFFCTEAKPCQQSAKACLMASSWLQMPTILNSTQHQKTERTVN